MSEWKLTSGHEPWKNDDYPGWEISTLMCEGENLYATKGPDTIEGKLFDSFLHARTHVETVSRVPAWRRFLGWP